jgi:hypothetical protein
MADGLCFLLLLRHRTVLPESFAHCVLLVVDPTRVPTSSDRSICYYCCHSLRLAREYINGYFHRTEDLRQLVWHTVIHR